LETLGPSFAKRWQDFFANQPDKPVMWIGPLAAYCGGNAAAAGNKFYTVGYYTVRPADAVSREEQLMPHQEYPASLGRTHIKSADPYTPLDVEPGFLDKFRGVFLARGCLLMIS
jgi:alcohol oxidase